VRIIAATNRNLSAEVAAARFRSDLFFRLNVVPLTVPPLRERVSDIPLFVTFFLSRFAARFGRRIERVERETMDRLVRYAWPGNVRELQNVIERAVVLSATSVLRLGPDLLPVEGVSTAESEQPAPGDEALLTLEEVERRHIHAVLAHTNGVVEGPEGAARILALHPNTLRSRMKKLGLPARSEMS
jgi:formate hydrogenlyase transcriptional activator